MSDFGPEPWKRPQIVDVPTGQVQYVKEVLTPIGPKPVARFLTADTVPDVQQYEKHWEVLDEPRIITRKEIVWVDDDGSPW